MTDPTPNPLYVSDPPVKAAEPLNPQQTHTEAEEEYLEDLHRQLKPEAQLAYVNFYLARTPAHLQQDMKDLIEGDLADLVPPPETEEDPVVDKAGADAVDPPDPAPTPAPDPAPTPTLVDRMPSP